MTVAEQGLCGRWRAVAGGGLVPVVSRLGFGVWGDSSPVVVEEVVGGGGWTGGGAASGVGGVLAVGGTRGGELAGMEEAEEERRGRTWRVAGLCVEKDRRRCGEEEEDQGERRGRTMPLTRKGNPFKTVLLLCITIFWS
jgi:hypothetical protein